MTTDQFHTHVSRLFIKPSDTVGRMVHASLGLCTEAGELGTSVKAHWVYGRELDRANVLEEAGDALFYLTALLTECGFTLDDAMAANVEKLKARYPNGYTDADANARKDKQ